MTIPQPSRPAAVWKRVGAGLVDFVLMWLVVWPAICLVGFGDVDNEIEFMRGAIGWRWSTIRAGNAPEFTPSPRDA